MISIDFYRIFRLVLGQSGRVCMNSCYSNDQPIVCQQGNLLKSVQFDPPFLRQLPSIHLRLIRYEA